MRFVPAAVRMEEFAAAEKNYKNLNKRGRSGHTINVHWNPSNEVRKMSEILILPY